MNQIPAGPPSAKPSVIETAQDFFAWLDEAVEAEERAERTEAEDKALQAHVREQVRRRFR